MKNNLKKLTFGVQNKLIFSFGLPAILIILGIFAIVTHQTRITINEANEERYSFINEKAYEAFRVNYEELEADTGNWILGDSVQYSLSGKGMTIADRSKVDRSMAFLQNEDVEYSLYLDNQGNVYSRKTITKGYDEIMNTAIIRSVGNYAGSNLYYGPDELFGSDGSYLYYVRSVQGIDHDYEPGILCIKLKNDVVSGIFENVDTQGRAFQVLLDENLQVCGYYGHNLEKNTTEEGRQWLAEHAGDGKILAEGGLLFTREHEPTGFVVATFVPRTILMAPVYRLYKTFLVLLIIVVVLSVIVCREVAVRMTRPIDIINQHMQEFDDTKLDDTIILSTNTELDTIGSSYNAMVSRTSDLIETIYRNQEESKRQEINLLVNQLHPHFLYNTLDTIYMLARMNHDDPAAKMIYGLTTFLRINLSNGAEDIPLEKELEHVKAYMDVQTIRNDDLFTYEIHCDPAIKDVKICKIILQPLAGNAIKHGFRTLDEGGLIRICCSRSGEMLHIVFENNGEVITEEAMTRLNALTALAPDQLAASEDADKGGYGIINVLKRLRLKYGTRLHFAYSRTETMTVCTMDLPVFTKKEGV